MQMPKLWEIIILATSLFWVVSGVFLVYAIGASILTLSWQIFVWGLTAFALANILEIVFALAFD